MENNNTQITTNKTSKFIISLIQMKVINDKDANVKRAGEMIDTAVKLYKSNVIVLPEFFNCPIDRLEGFTEEENNSPTLEFLKTKAKEHKIYLIGGSMPISNNGKIYNTCFCIDNQGEVKTTFKKLHLFDVDIPGKITFKESAKLTPGEEYGIFDTEYGRFGIGICYDIRFPEYALLLRQEYNIDFLIYPAAFNTVTGPLHWDILIKARALDNHVFLGICSQGRNVDEPSRYQAWGHSTIVDPYGQFITTTGHEEDILSSVIDLVRNNDIRESIPVWKQKRSDLYSVTKLK